MSDDIYDMMPRCVFGAGTPRQCRRIGIGVPPLCQKHYAMAETMGSSGPSNDTDSGALLGAAISILLAHPKVAAIIDDIRETLLDFGPPPDPHYAECPPRQPNQRRPPPPPPPRQDAEDPRIVMGFPPTAKLTRQLIKQRQRQLAALLHPDKGGSEEAMKRLNAATQRLLSQVG